MLTADRDLQVQVLNPMEAAEPIGLGNLDGGLARGWLGIGVAHGVTP
jgi:hypothetical protein